MRYNGIPINEGTVIGHISRKIVYVSPVKARENTDPGTERMRFFDALLEYESSMKKIAAESGESDGRDILGAQIMIARDPALSESVTAYIDSGVSAERALELTCDRYRDMLESSGDETIMSRSEDLDEVMQGILFYLHSETDGEGHAAEMTAEAGKGDGDVIFADSLSVAEIMALKKSAVRAVVMRKGTTASHAAVLMRSMGLTAVFGTDFSEEDAQPGRECIVDGYDGIVIIRPSEDEKQWYRMKADSAARNLAKEEDTSAGICMTLDGRRILILSNIGSESVPAAAAGCDGAGLVRTEFIFMNDAAEASEDDQVVIYSGIADAFGGNNVCIRTLDAGGDKIAISSDEEGENPALGVRGIRASLLDTDSFKKQLRAILRAAYGRNISIMLPMVSSADEIERVRLLIGECMDELSERKLSFEDNIKLGCMIETPAAVMCADELAQSADFFSVGTNDLAQYIMCADRGNPFMSELCSIYQPAVIRALGEICNAASRARIPVGICGEAAADVRMIPVFVGLGVKSFSVDPSRILRVKKAVEEMSAASCRELALRVLAAHSKEEVLGELK